MSNRANSSARNRRAGPSTNIQETLTSNPNMNNIQQSNQNVKEEPKLLSITQAFILINGKIRNLENQVESLKKYNGVIPSSSDSVNTQQAIKADDELSDVSEFKPTSNMDDDFYQTNENNMTTNNMQSENIKQDTNHSIFNEPSPLQEEKVREMVKTITNENKEQIENLYVDNNNIKEQFVNINEKTENLSSKLNSIEQLFTNIQELNTKLPKFMSSVDERFNSLQNNSQETMNKVDNVLLKYNEQLDGVKERMSGLQDYAVNLHSLFLKRFDEHVDQNFEVKNLKKELSVMKEKQVIFNMENNQEKEVENYIKDTVYLENEENNDENNDENNEENNEENNDEKNDEYPSSEDEELADSGV